MNKVLAVLLYAEQEIKATRSKKNPNGHFTESEIRHILEILDMITDELTRYCKGENQC